MNVRLRSSLHKLMQRAKTFGAGNWINMMMAITALIALSFQWRENQRRDREVAELRTLAVGLEKEVQQRRNSILYLLDSLDLSRQELWGRMRWSDDVLRKRRVLIHDQQALAGLALHALAIAGKQEKNRERILGLVARIGEKQRSLQSQLMGWADAETEAIKAFDAKTETLMQLQLSPEKEQKEHDDLQAEYRKNDELMLKHYDPIVTSLQKEASDLGNELHDLLRATE